jgi:hypothetical protein
MAIYFSTIHPILVHSTSLLYPSESNTMSTSRAPLSYRFTDNSVVLDKNLLKDLFNLDLGLKPIQRVLDMEDIPENGLKWAEWVKAYSRLSQIVIPRYGFPGNSATMGRDDFISLYEIGGKLFTHHKDPQHKLLGGFEYSQGMARAWPLFLERVEPHLHLLEYDPNKLDPIADAKRALKKALSLLRNGRKQVGVDDWTEIGTLLSELTDEMPSSTSEADSGGPPKKRKNLPLRPSTLWLSGTVPASVETSAIKSAGRRSADELNDLEGITLVWDKNGPSPFTVDKTKSV